MIIPEFLRGFAKPAQGAIKVGDTMKNKDTKIISQCIAVHDGLLYGRASNGMINTGKIENFDKI